MQHKTLEKQDIHAPFGWTVIDAQDRLALVVLAEDVNRLVLQLDDDSVWRVESTSPTVWRRLDAKSVSDLLIHSSNTNNPHQVTATQVGAYTKAETDALIAYSGGTGGGAIQEVFIGEPAMLPTYPGIVFVQRVVEGQTVYEMNVNVP